MTYELKVYQYNKHTQQLEHTNTIVDTDNEHANKELAKIFVDKSVRGTKTKLTYKYEQDGHAKELHITQTWINATDYVNNEPCEYKITVKYEYTFHDCTL